ncbi:PREDICTED: uncharacterized protein LOC101294851 [Fragaria vesca subsp. vesca]
MPRGTPHVSASVNAGTSNDSNEAPNLESEIIDDRAPLWKYAKKIERYGTVGGSWKWQCNFCKLFYNGSHTRVRQHLLKERRVGVTICKKVNPHVFAQMTKLVKDYNERIANRGARQVLLPLSTSRRSSAARGS